MTTIKKQDRVADNTEQAYNLTMTTWIPETEDDGSIMVDNISYTIDQEQTQSMVPT